MKRKHSFFKRNGLSIVLLLLAAIFLFGQFMTGYRVHNEELLENAFSPISLGAYFFSGHFLQATFENWESEFLQMMLYILLTIKLFQIGSSESKDLDKIEEVDKKPKPGPLSPWPVKKGGLWLAVYNHSLSLAFGILFLLSFSLHYYGSWLSFNEQQVMKGLQPAKWGEYIGSSQFWFESFQNWQSEFMAVSAIVILSIYLRQKGSPQSKPVDRPHFETGK